MLLLLFALSLPPQQQSHFTRSHTPALNFKLGGDRTFIEKRQREGQIGRRSLTDRTVLGSGRDMMGWDGMGYTSRCSVTYASSSGTP